MQIIKSLKIKKNKKYQIIYSDFETIVYNNTHYISCYSLVSMDETPISKTIEYTTNIQSESDKLMDSFFNDCLNYFNNNHETYIYFHNLGRFDSIFILNYILKNNIDVDIISRDNTYYQIKCRIKNKYIIFRDSYLMFPTSLNKMAKTFLKDENIEKQSFNHEENIIERYIDNNFRKKVEIYCISDSSILMLSYEKYNQYIQNEFNISIMESLTLSSLSFKIFRTHFYNDNNYKIQHVEGNLDKFIRDSYKGGIVDVYKPLLKNGYLYDVNSLYPYVMKKYDIPLHLSQWIRIENSKFDINDFFGFIDVEVESPKDMYIPYLSTMSKDGGLISPLGSWIGIYFSEEIKYALTLGYKFKYINAVSFVKGNIFNDFVSTLYKKRIENKHNPLNNIMKMILNSLYGRFGMKNEVEKTMIMSTDKLLSLLKIYDIKHVNRHGGYEIVKVNPIPSLQKVHESLTTGYISMEEFNKYKKQINTGCRHLNTAVQLASAITAYARIEMHKLKMEYKDNLYYSDTDSLFLDIKLPDSLVSDSELGKLKLESVITEAVFVGPKLYYYKTDKDNIKSKGIESNIIEKEHIISLYNETKLRPFSILRSFIRNLKTFSIHKRESEYIISGNFTKRDKIYTNGMWSDTKPLRINK